MAKESKFYTEIRSGKGRWRVSGDETGLDAMFKIRKEGESFLAFKIMGIPHDDGTVEYLYWDHTMHPDLAKSLIRVPAEVPAEVPVEVSV